MVDVMPEKWENMAMKTGKPPPSAASAKPHRRVRLSKETLRFISENQRLSGFSGRITKKTAVHEVDMDEIAASAKRLNAQIPCPENRRPKPRITKFGSHPD
jgi:hypothetical protein